MTGEVVGERSGVDWKEGEGSLCGVYPLLF